MWYVVITNSNIVPAYQEGWLTDFHPLAAIHDYVVVTCCSSGKTKKTHPLTADHFNVSLRRLIKKSRRRGLDGNGGSNGHDGDGDGLCQSPASTAADELGVMELLSCKSTRELFLQVSAYVRSTGVHKEC